MKWETVRLGDIADSCLGKMLDQDKNKGEYQPYLANVNVRWGDFDLENLSQMRFLETENDRYGLKYGDLIICEGGEPGRCAIWKDQMPNMKIQKALHRVRVHENVDYRYLYYWFFYMGSHGALDQYCTGSTIKHMPGDKLKRVIIDLPPFEKQTQIADILSDYDNLIEVNNKRIKVLEQMAENLYKEWFVRFRFPGHETAEFENGIPKGWKIDSIKETFDIFDTMRFPLSSLERDKMKKIYPYYGAAEILDYVEDYLFDGVYLLMGEDGSVITPDGKPMLQYVWGKFWVNNHAHILRGKGSFSTEYLYLMLRNTDVNGFVTGSAQPKISQGRLFRKKAIVPSDSIVEQFNSMIAPMFKQIRSMSEQIKILIKQRDLLLPRLMSGKLEV